MNFELKEIRDLKIYSMDTSEDVLQINDEQLKLNTIESKDMHKKNKLTTESTMTFDTNINKENLYHILGYDMSNTPDSHCYSIHMQMQKRRHKKKRINKKYAKKYGYHYITINNCKIEYNDNNRFEIHQL